MASYTGYLTTRTTGEDYTLNLLPTYRRTGYGQNYGRYYGGEHVGYGMLYGYFYSGYLRGPIDTLIHEITEVSPGGGDQTDNQPISNREAVHTGYYPESLVTFFYNRILVEPVEINFGTVVTTQEKSVNVWNAYLEEDIDLTSINETGFDGLVTIGDAPPPDVEFKRLLERTYAIRVLADGPPNIDATLTFNWEATYGSNLITIIGERIVLYPYYYKKGFSEVMEWSTKVLTSIDGSEKRSRIRTSPRHKYSAQSFIPPEEHARLDNMLYGWRSQVWAVPVRGEARTVASAVTDLDTTINVSTLYGDFREGGLALIYDSIRNFDLFEILSLTDTSITLDRGVAGAFSAAAVVVPVRKGRMRQEPSRLSSGYNATVKVQFDIDDNLQIASAASAETYLGEDTYIDVPLKPNGNTFPESYQKDIELVDFITGPVNQYSFWDNTKIRREFLVVLEGLQEIWEFRTWLHRRAGKQRPFYMPTFEGNLRPVGEGNIGTSFNAVDDDNAKLASTRTHIYVKMKDGTHYFRRITDIFSAPDSEVLVAIDSTIVEDLQDISYISYMGLKRLSSDRIQFKWLQNDVVECKIPIVEVTP